jgi:sporulation protein YlmC with PRC-barrel domain
MTRGTQAGHATRKEKHHGNRNSSKAASNLIGSDKVEGTPVYRSNGGRVGQIERVMIDKFSGKVAYAVMSFGGFLGIGEDYYPLPWSVLTYDPTSAPTKSTSPSNG